MKKNLCYLMLLLFLGVVSCSKQDEQSSDQEGPALKVKSNLTAVPSGAAYDKAKLDQIVISTLEGRNDFQWEMVDLKTLWSALQYGDQSLAIGYKPASEGDISGKIHTLNVKSGAYKQVHDALIELILSELNAGRTTKVTLADILVEDDPVLPILTIKLTNKEVLTTLYNLENVRYLEPLDYWPNDPNRSSSGLQC
ncbi:MAG: hypothetical protein IPP46_01375 [Bacteroidetes bacterium]|nr:hypothetical protein [Bacteroidota bacterium]